VPSSSSFQENKIKKKKSKIRKIEEKKIKIVSIQMSMTVITTEKMNIGHFKQFVLRNE